MLAVKVAALVAMFAAPVLAQPPGYPPNYQPNYPPGSQPNYPPAGNQFQQPGSQPGMLPYPPGYRPRTPPAQSQPAGQPQRFASPVPPEGGSGGTVMYFQKPADALTATGGPGSTADGVAQLNNPARDVPPLSLPDASAPALPPPPPPSRYPPSDRGQAIRPSFVPAATAMPTTYFSAQDKDPPLGPDGLPLPKPGGSGDIPPTTAQKKEIKEPPGGAAVTQIPPREKIFTVYNDAQLEKAIMDSLIQDLLETNARKDPKERKTPEEVIRDQAQYLKFPPLPVLSPPSVPYRAKTYAYEPRKLVVEPFYVVHRRLYFEEKNGERTGWDLGPLSTLTAVTHFYADTILWPAHVFGGCEYGYWDTSAGKCLPGSPTPYFLYPPELTLSGSVFQAGVVTGFAFLFP